MNKYQNGKIYKIICDKSDKIYIGSTILKLNQRFNLHKSLKDCSTKELFELGEVKIELIENYSCNSKKELQIKERYYLEKYKDTIINKLIPIRTKEESKKLRNEATKIWRSKNKEHIKEYQKKSIVIWRAKNKDKINEKAKLNIITCDCGSVIRKDSSSKHKKSIKILF